VFIRPRFAPDGGVIAPARVTVFHNGVVVHHGDRFTGRTVHGREATYEAHQDRLPLLLQDHGSRVRFRNIWVRELGDDEGGG
jgi:3-keto-disaccharide hydrolase